MKPNNAYIRFAERTMKFEYPESGIPLAPGTFLKKRITDWFPAHFLGGLLIILALQPFTHPERTRVSAEILGGNIATGIGLQFVVHKILVFLKRRKDRSGRM